MFRATAIILAALLIAGAAFLPSTATAAQRVSVTLVSDATTDVVETAGKALTPYAWPVWPVLQSAVPVWVDDFARSSNFGPYTFRKTFDVPAGAAAFTGSVQVTSDNAYQLWVNGSRVGGDGQWTSSPSACLTDGSEYQTVETYDVAGYLRAGQTNTLEVRALNYQEKTQPAGCAVAPEWWGANPAMVNFRADVSWLPLTAVDLSVLDPVELNGAGLVRVAVLTTPGFEAFTVDPVTACFGSTAFSTLRDCTAVDWAVADVDADGDVDLVLRFEEAQTGFLAGDTTATLTGKTTDGGNVEGTAAVTFYVAPVEDPLLKLHGRDKGCNLERNADGTNCAHGQQYVQVHKTKNTK